MKRLKYIGILTVLILGMVSCDDYLDINADPDSPSKVDASLIMPAAMFYASQLQYDHAEYGVYLSQCLTTTGRSQKSGLPYQSGWAFLTINRHPQWRRHFYDIGRNLYELDKEAEENNLYDYLLLSRTLVLMSTQMTTDVFGPIPRTDVFKSSTPHFDDQEEVYEWMYNEIDEILREYEDPKIYSVTKPLTRKEDRVFAGDMRKWRQFAYALKARLLLRNLPSMNNTSTICDEIIKAAETALNGWEEPLYKYDGGVNEQNCPWGISAPKVNAWESRDNQLAVSVPSRFFMEQMLKYDAAQDTIQDEELFRSEEHNDPRIPYLMQKRASGGVYAYRYLENNYGKPTSLENTHYPDLYESTLTTNQSAISFFPTAELHFIIAEAAYWKGGSKDRAVAALKDGVVAHMKHLNVPQADIDRYLSSDLIPGTSNIRLSDIMREKYIAMYLQPEQWNDIRRYNYSNNEQKKFGLPGEEVIVYPTLRRPYNLYASEWNVNDPNEWIQRINYDPQTENVYNTNELIRLGALFADTKNGNPEWLKKPLIWSPAYTK